MSENTYIKNLKKRLEKRIRWVDMVQEVSDYEMLAAINHLQDDNANLRREIEALKEVGK